MLTELSCPSITEGNADYPLTVAGSQQVQGTCAAGYSGTPRRSCGLDGNWGTISGACTGTLPALSARRPWCEDVD